MNPNHRIMKHLLSTILITFIAVLVNAQEFTKTLPEGGVSPQAKIESMAWLAGHWSGEAFGGIVEEVWMPPLGKSMMCVFKLVVEEQVKFYEIVTITEENESLMLRLKHFHKDLKGWEEKDETIDFKLVELAENKAYFEGFTIERIDENHINMYIQIGDEGNIEEVKFAYSRVTN